MAMPINAQATEADKIVKDVEAIFLPIIESVLQSQCPELALPVVKQISNAIEQATANELAKYAEEYLTFQVIDNQVDGEENNLTTSIEKISSDEKQGAINLDDLQKFADAQSALIHFDGSAKPE